MIVVKRAWLPVAIVALVAIACFAVYRLHAAFGFHGGPPSVGAHAEDIRPFNPKRVTLEVFGTGTTADINYLDVDAAPQRADGMPLPWIYRGATTAPAVSVNVVAQGDGGVIGCRITVNGAVEDQRTVEGIRPQTFCLVKSA